MKVGIIGSGGREHVICQSLKNSNKISKIFCFPGNAGTQQIAENVKIDLEKFENLKNFAKNIKFQQLSLEFLKIIVKQKILLIILIFQ